MDVTKLKELCFNNAIDFTVKGAKYYFCWRGSDKNEEITIIDDWKLTQMSWPEIKHAVVNGRNVQHVTRVVGYYSKTRNWNPSKIGELKDRQAGDYAISPKKSKLRSVG